MRLVVAPDSFKGSIDASAAAGAIADGWCCVRPDDEIVLLPQADGGEGTLDAVEASVPGAERRSAGTVTGPDGRPVEADWLLLPDGTAVVELARSSGLPLMARLDPIGATTRGLGEVIAAALDAGARAIVIGVGGSASTDAGLGALEALEGYAPPPGGVRVLSDVTAPLLGPEGAAAVFAPQKGAGPEEVAILERRLEEAAARLGGDPDAPGAGAAGGTAYGFAAAWGATIESGSASIAELTGLTRTEADVLITGEGRYDATSSTGKVVGHALGVADRIGATPVVIAGALAAEPVTPAGRPAAGIGLVDLAGSAEAAIAEPARWLREAGAVAARTAV